MKHSNDSLLHKVTDHWAKFADNAGEERGLFGRAACNLHGVNVFAGEFLKSFTRLIKLASRLVVFCQVRREGFRVGYHYSTVSFSDLRVCRKYHLMENRQ